MRVVYIDCDSLRPDHLGCYGYHRDTSPNIDQLAQNGRHFENVYTSDAPCLPSRTALFTGRYGIHTGVIGHGGLEADPRPLGSERDFNANGEFRTLAQSLRNAGLRTVMVSPFPTRHAAWHVLDGFDRWIDTGEKGLERADQIFPYAERWLRDNASADNWFLHVNFWDPHIPYDAPPEYGNPFEEDPAPSWPDEETIRRHYQSYGPHSAHDLLDFGENPAGPREPSEIASREDFEQYVDGYDVGIHYLDHHVGLLIKLLKDEGVFEDTLVIVGADHGENLGELNVYGDHQTADDKTCRVPLIVHGPGVDSGVDEDFHYQFDLAPTLVEIVGDEPPSRWDARSFAPSVTDGESTGRESVVISQGAHVAQRGVRWDRWLLVRTYHDGIKPFEPTMLFDLEADPHETTNLAAERSDVVGEGIQRLETWHAARMNEAARGKHGGNPNTPRGIVDPIWTVVRDGGPYHASRTCDLEAYLERLRSTGRSHHAETISRQYGSSHSDQ